MWREIVEAMNEMMETMYVTDNPEGPFSVLLLMPFGQ